MFAVTAPEVALLVLHAAVMVVVLAARASGRLGLRTTLLLLAVTLALPVVGPVLAVALLVRDRRGARVRRVVASA